MLAIWVVNRKAWLESVRLFINRHPVLRAIELANDAYVPTGVSLLSDDRQASDRKGWATNNPPFRNIDFIICILQIVCGASLELNPCLPPGDSDTGVFPRHIDADTG